MSGEVDLKKGSSGRSRSSFKTNTSTGLQKESVASSKSALGKVDSSSKGNISSSITTTGTTFSSSAGDSSIETNTAAADSSSINESHTSPLLVVSQSTSNKHAATVAVSSNPAPLSATTKTNTTTKLASGEVGVNPSTGKSAATFLSTASSKPAVPCEGTEATTVSFARSSSGISTSSSAGNSPRIPRKERSSNNNNNNSNSNNTNVTPGPECGSSPKLTFNPSFEGNSQTQNNQNPRPHSSPEKTGSSSLSARLSLKSLGRRRSPVRTQFTLPSSSSTSTTGTDQIPKDSISAQTNTHSVVAGGASDVSSSCVTGNNSGGGGSQTSRGLLRRSKKDRGASSSASPPLIRSSTSPSPQQNPSVTLANKASASSGTNPTPTVPADPNIPWVPGTSAPISVDRAHSVKITRKILHNWRSACGRTKDRTKDLIRRWKTLPENHPDFDLPPSPGTSKKKVSSTSNLNNNSPATKKKLQGESSGGSSSGGGGAAGGATSVSRNEQKQPSVTVTNTELQSSKKSSSKQQQRTENEMPVVGHGKGSSSTGDGAGSASAGGTSSSLGGASNTAGRLSAGMTGIGRPSISVNNSSTMVNGRTSNMDTSSSGAVGVTSGAQPKSSTGWTVHVWATYVQRDDLEQGLDNEEPKKPDRELYLSEFQRIKLTHFFRHVLDMNHDDVISAEDFVALNQRIRHYIEWSSECIEFHILKEVHSGFLECFLNQPLDDCSVMYYCSSERETRQHVNIDEWLDVWGGLLRSARTMEALPLWLQYFPKILFQVINKSGSGTISREELRAFYTMFLGIDFRVVNETLEAIHKAMTDGGRHKITYDLFKLCFANFLLGKYPNGPGQYLFGICSPQTLECSFPIDYSALNTHPDDLEPYDPEKDKSQKAMKASSSIQSSRS